MQFNNVHNITLKCSVQFELLVFPFFFDLDFVFNFFIFKFFFLFLVFRFLSCRVNIN